MSIHFSPSESILIKDLSQVGNARRQAVACAKDLQFNDTDAGTVALVVTELATNLVKHANGGELLLRPLQVESHSGIEIISLDKGPGMSNIQRCIEDGYSTAGSAGTGLGAIKRLSSDFDVYSQALQGTVLISKIWAKSSLILPELPIELGAISRPVKGEQECGDGWKIHAHSTGLRLFVADGLGHGPIAARAREMASEVFDRHPEQPLLPLMQLLHKALLSTRGAAIALASIDFEQEELRFVGIGNISASIVHGLKSKGIASYNGTVGHQMHKAQEFVYECPKEALILLHSDGLSERWKFEGYPGLAHRHPGLIASVLYRDHQRTRDDATILTIKRNEQYGNPPIKN